MNRKKRFIKATSKNLGYLISLPERALRSLASLTGGASTFLTDTIFPESVRGTVVYKITVGMMQKFIIERVAGVDDGSSDPRMKIGNDYIKRKMAGTALEAAGLFAMRFSPLWVFAIAGDSAGGSKVFLERLVKHLKENEVIHPDVKVFELIDVLEAVQEAAGSSAATIDMPPLSRDALSELAADLKASYSRVFRTTANLIPNFDEIWEIMEKLARREKISIETLGGIVTVEALAFSRKGRGVLSATGRTGIELFDENILNSYRKTLGAVSNTGIDKYISHHMKPFMKIAISHFDPENLTWIESKFRKPI